MELSQLGIGVEQSLGNRGWILEGRQGKGSFEFLRESQ